jgi:hypothetical protein
MDEIQEGLQRIAKAMHGGGDYLVRGQSEDTPMD